MAGMDVPVAPLAVALCQMLIHVLACVRWGAHSGARTRGEEMRNVLREVEKAGGSQRGRVRRRRCGSRGTRRRPSPPSPLPRPCALSFDEGVCPQRPLAAYNCFDHRHWVAGAKRMSRLWGGCTIHWAGGGLSLDEKPDHKLKVVYPLCRRKLSRA
jgi:hypothetical protein